VIDGEKQIISENVMTYWVEGDPVELPASPCPEKEWDAWYAEFLRTHPLKPGKDGTVAANVRQGTNGTCFLITPAR
jgi:hypothetical protein